MAEFESIQDVLNDFRDNVIREAKKNLSSQNTSGRLRDSLKSTVKESKNSIQISFEMEEYGFYQDRGVKGKKSGKSLDGYKYTNKPVGLEPRLDPFDVSKVKGAAGTLLL